jgi:peptidoglycan hydrolase-like protein with peptidoglycan-binding domain
MIHNFNQFLQSLNENFENINPKELKLGSGGIKNPKEIDDVKKLQKILIDKGLLKIKSGVPSGYFGELTAGALKKYQESEGKASGLKNQPSQTLAQIKNPAYTPPSESTRVDSTERLRVLHQWWSDKCGKMSLRTAVFISEMQKENKLKNYSFLVANKKAGVISLFAPGYKFVDKSFFVSGRFKDQGLGTSNKLTYSDKYSLIVKYARDHPKEKVSIDIKNYLQKYGLDLNSNLAQYKLKSGKSFPEKGSPFMRLFYSDTASGLTSPGVFKVGRQGTYAPGYTVGGSKDPQGKIPTGNIFRLYTLDSNELMPMAVHGHSNPDRAKSAEEIEKNYAPLTLVGNLASDKGRVGAGCLNVDRKFLEQIGKNKPEYIIILPDTGDDKELIPVIVTTSAFQDMLNRIEKEGKDIGKELYNNVKRKLAGSLLQIFK